MDIRDIFPALIRPWKTVYMNPLIWLLSTISVFMALAITDAARPRIEKLAAPPSPIEIDDAFIASEYKPFEEGAPQYAQRFTSRTPKLQCVVLFKKTPPDGTKVNCNVKGPAGKVEGSGLWVQVGNVHKSGIKVWTDIEPKKGFADGAYQAVITINGVSIYRLNWAMGSK